MDFNLQETDDKVFIMLCSHCNYEEALHIESLKDEEADGSK
jgi:hypothetical protein